MCSFSSTIGSPARSSVALISPSAEVGVADHDPPSARLHFFGRADDDPECRDRRQVRRIDLAGELDVDDLTVERRPAEVVRGVDHEQLTVGQQTDLIAVRGLADVLRGHEDRAPAILTELAEPLPELGPQDRIDPCRRLVEKQDRRVVDEAGGERQPSLHPARHLTHSLVAVLRQLHPLQQLTQAPAATKAQPVHRGMKAEVLPQRQLREQRRDLRQVADPLPLAIGEPSGRRAVDRRPSLRRLVQPGEQPDRGRLPAAARSDEADDAPGGDLKIDAPHDGDAVERFSETPTGDHRPGARVSHSLSSCVGPAPHVTRAGPVPTRAGKETSHSASAHSRTGIGLSAPGNNWIRGESSRGVKAMTMWDYRADLDVLDRDLVGYDVEATDGKIGKIDESTYDVGASYLVVDTGFWIFGKKRMIPAGVVERIDDTDEKVYVRLTKDDIKSAPDFEEQHRRERELYDKYYETYWS